MFKRHKYVDDYTPEQRLIDVEYGAKYFIEKWQCVADGYEDIWNSCQQYFFKYKYTDNPPCDVSLISAIFEAAASHKRKHNSSLKLSFEVDADTDPRIERRFLVEDNEKQYYLMIVKRSCYPTYISLLQTESIKRYLPKMVDGSSGENPFDVEVRHNLAWILVEHYDRRPYNYNKLNVNDERYYDWEFTGKYFEAMIDILNGFIENGIVYCNWNTHTLGENMDNHIFIFTDFSHISYDTTRLPFEKKPRNLFTSSIWFKKLQELGICDGDGGLIGQYSAVDVMKFLTKLQIIGYFCGLFNSKYREDIDFHYNASNVLETEMEDEFTYKLPQKVRKFLRFVKVPMTTEGDGPAFPAPDFMSSDDSGSSDNDESFDNTSGDSEYFDSSSDGEDDRAAHGGISYYEYYVTHGRMYDE